MKFCLVLCLFVSAYCSITQAQADCAGDVSSAIKSTLSNGPFRLNIESEMDGEKSTSVLEVVAKDRMRLDPYTMTPNGYFMGGTQLGDDGKVMFSMSRPLVLVGDKGIENPECVGASTLEGASYTQFNFQTPSALLGMMGTAIVTLYVADDGKPAWLLMATEVPGVGKQTVKAKYNFDSSIVVDDPK
jgi:hypothetical protein